MLIDKSLHDFPVYQLMFIKEQKAKHVCHRMLVIGGRQGRMRKQDRSKNRQT